MAVSPGQVFHNWWRKAPVTVAIIALNIAVFFACAIQARTLLGDVAFAPILQRGQLWGPALAQDNPLTWWPVLSSAFIHLNLSHLGVNMFMLVFVGTIIEVALGSRLFALIYLGGALGASATILAMDFDAPTVGASGALFALLVVLVAVYQKQHADLRAPAVLLAVNIGYTFIDSGVSVWGHLGGALWGLLLMGAILLRRKVLWVLVVCLVAAGAVVAVMLGIGDNLGVLSTASQGGSYPQ